MERGNIVTKGTGEKLSEDSAIKEAYLGKVKN